MVKEKIFITGGSGFVGKNLIRKIEKNKDYPLKILSRINSNDKKYLKGDLLNKKSIESLIPQKAVVIHLAFSKKYSENIIMIKNLIDVCKNKKVKKIILLSSMATKRNYPDDYGKIKKIIEEKVKNSGINYCILRPTMIYGAGSTSFNFIIDSLKKFPFVSPIIGSGRYIISPVHVEDVIESIISCIKNNKTDRKEYDISGGEKIYFIDLINGLKKESGIKKPNIYVPLFFCKIIVSLYPKLMSKENLKNLTQDSLVDTKPAKKDFNYSPKKLISGGQNVYL